MAIGRPLEPIILSAETREQLESMARSRSLPHGLVRRAKIILMAAGGLNNMTIAQRIGLSNYTVGVWRQRFVKQGLMGLYDEPRAGGPRSIHDEEIARLIRKTLKTKPKNQTHWTCRSIAKETKLSKSTVQRRVFPIFSRKFTGNQNSVLFPGK